MSNTLMQNTYEKLRNRIFNGELPPGTRLVNRVLSKDFGISTVTLREAIHRLTSEGLVEHIPNAGAYVRKLNRKEIVSLFRFREAIECFAVVEAMPRLREDQFDQLEAVCSQWHEMTRQIRQLPGRRADAEFHRRWLQLDARFHRILVEAADNPWLTKSVQDMQLMAHVVKAKPAYLSLGVAADTWHQHVKIVQALRAGDAELARRRMSRHILTGIPFALESSESDHV